MRRAITRRRALGEMLAGTALLATGCGGGSPRPASSGSTLRSTYVDPGQTGVLQVGAGEALRPRTELLGTRVAPRALNTLTTLAMVTDAHVLDAQSPARVTFLDRLGPPFQSTFRPHETLTAQVLAGALGAVQALGPDAVIQGGDLIDNDQANELALALAVMRGGRARPGSGGPGSVGVQSPADADPFYYRPDLDAPVHHGLLEAATRSFASPGAGRAWLPVLGDHDILVAGEIAPTAQTRALAVGGEAVWDLPPGLTSGLGPASRLAGAGADALSPDGPPGAQLVNTFLQRALAAPKVRVRADAGRRQLSAAEAVATLSRETSRTPRAGFLDYSTDLGAHLRVIVLDLARRDGGSGGLVHPGQPAWLERQLVAAGSRWVLVVSHQPLASSQGGPDILAQLDAHPRVIAALSGHTHRNRITPRATSTGGYWLISTASLIDFPQQARALRVRATADGGVAIQTWMLDHIFPGSLGTTSRALAYLDAQGGRPAGLAGARLDRNVTLYVPPVRA